MKKIYKYNLEVKDFQRIWIPMNSRILSVHEQNNEIVIYALVDLEQQLNDVYEFIIHGTGHNADDLDEFRFLGTVKLHEGKLMFHVFYK